MKKQTRNIASERQPKSLTGTDLTAIRGGAETRSSNPQRSGYDLATAKPL